MPIPFSGPTTVTLNDIAIRVKRQFGDTANIQIDDTDIIRWATDAIRDIALNNDIFQTIGTVNVIPAVADYSLPSDILTLRSIRYNGQKLYALNSNEAEEYLAKSDLINNSGTPTHFSTWGGTITMYPIPDSTVAVLKVYYTRQPVLPTLITDGIELPVQYHNIIRDYCLQQAYELDENWTAAQTKGAQFTEGVRTLKTNATWEHQDYYPMITSTDIAESPYNGW